MGVNSLPKTVTRQRSGCDLNLGPFAPESSTLTTRLPSHICCIQTTQRRQTEWREIVTRHLCELIKHDVLLLRIATLARQSVAGTYL